MTVLCKSLKDLRKNHADEMNIYSIIEDPAVDHVGAVTALQSCPSSPHTIINMSDISELKENGCGMYKNLISVFSKVSWYI